ncbi:MAG: DNA-binding protein WhiA [Saccharothrix sp.]|nr:DNA-binding protein WhiA [Saccharothrix sp.]
MTPFKDVLDELTRFRTADHCCARVHLAAVVRLSGSPEPLDATTVEVDDPAIAAWVCADLHFLCGRSPLFRRVESHTARGATRYRADLAPPGPGATAHGGGADPVVAALHVPPQHWSQGRVCCSRALWRAALILRGRRRRVGYHGDLEASCPDRDTAEALQSAAAMLGIATTRRVERGGPVVIVRTAARVSRLLDDLDATGAATRWAAIVTTAARPTNGSIALYNVERARTTSRELCARLREALEVLGRDAPEGLRAFAERRLAHPDVSLTQLAAECDPPLSRNTFARHLRRLIDLAERHRAATG